MICSTRAALACFLLLAIAGCQAKHEDQGAPPIRPVLYTAVAVETTELFGPFTGSVEPRYQSQLGFQIPGRMIARDVFVGDHVSNGQRLAAIDPTVPQFQLAQAQAEVANANAQLENAANVEARQRTLLAGGNVTLRRVAAILNQSPRTLQRRLAAEGTDFGGLVAYVRMQIVREQMAQPSPPPLARLAHLLGFSEASAACRFIRAQTGVPLRKLRAAAPSSHEVS